MSLQESQDSIEREPQELPQDSTVQDETPAAASPDSDAQVEASPEPVSVPATRSVPQSPESSIHTEGVDGPAWYVIHCYSGYENKVRHNLEQRIETMGMKDKIFDVVIPTQEEIEVKDGKRRTVERHIFPGYVLVNMALSEESWYVVRNTPGVTSFVGGSAMKPLSSRNSGEVKVPKPMRPMP